MGNLQRLRAAMAEKGIEALLASDINNVCWLTGFNGSNGYVLLTADEGLFVTDGRYTAQAKDQVKELPSETWPTGVDSALFLAEKARGLGMSKIAFEAEAVTFGAWQKWTKAFEGMQLEGVEGLFLPLRLVKTPDEVAKIREACRLADACFDHVLRMIQPGVSEWDIGMDIEFFFRRSGADVAFAPVVVSGERSALPHGRATFKLLEKGDFLTLDFGCKLDGYCSDMTRTVVVGEETPLHREIYEQVLKAQLAALDAMKPGVPGRDVDRLSREVLAERDLAQYYTHGLGHGLGTNVHDGGGMNSVSTVVLEPGQVWTVEPGAYIPGYGGVRIEDDVVVTESGIDLLTHSTKEMLVLPA